MKHSWKTVSLDREARVSIDVCPLCKMVRCTMMNAACRGGPRAYCAYTVVTKDGGVIRTGFAGECPGIPL